jgi:peptidoglycan/xylan/chitin deacetylase (PgdA/CDA1 family)
MSKFTITISIDDLHPETNWGVEGDVSMKYLESLNKKFGAKFTLFIPSNYHGNFPLSKHKEWIQWLKSHPYFELSAHGHFHQCKNVGIGEQEFLELDYMLAKQRLNESLSEWHSVDHIPKGFRMPGWGCNQESANAVSEVFSYVAAHELINAGINFNTKTLYGCYGINLTDDIIIRDNIIMFQSHIAGDWNDNVWNETNFNNLEQILDYIVRSSGASFKTLGEL